MFRFVLLAALFATAADAQQTRCKWVGNVWTCDEGGVNWGLSRPAPQPDINGSFAQGYQQGQAWRAAELRRRAGKMVQEGNCRGAADYAAANGDFELAGQIASYCAR